jgi:hypothetical protein
MLKLHSDLLKKIAEIILGYKADNDPAVKKLKNILELLNRSEWDRAKTLLNAPDLKKTMELRSQWYKDIPKLRDLDDAFSEAVRLINYKNPATTDRINQVINLLKSAEKEIGDLQKPQPRKEPELTYRSW